MHSCPARASSDSELRQKLIDSVSHDNNDNDNFAVSASNAERPEKAQPQACLPAFPEMRIYVQRPVTEACCMITDVGIYRFKTLHRYAGKELLGKNFNLRS